jgi:hypothetical protein
MLNKIKLKIFNSDISEQNLIRNQFWQVENPQKNANASFKWIFFQEAFKFIKELPISCHTESFWFQIVTFYQVSVSIWNKMIPLLENEEEKY